MSNPDLQFHNVGPFATCHAVTDAGANWLAENIGTLDDTPDHSWLDDGTIAIEFDCLPDIVEGARADGLICEG